jgi:hypothetical protein
LGFEAFWVRKRMERTGRRRRKNEAKNRRNSMTVSSTSSCGCCKEEEMATKSHTEKEEIMANDSQGSVLEK